jgi:uncharacterized protein (TIGR02996 family)
MTPTSSALRLALEQAVLDNPDDRAAHAAYADLLTEEGDPQGEFIQVQLRLEDESLPAEARHALRQREEELLAAHRARWVGAWADLAQPTGPEGRGQVDFPGPKPARFVRGLLAEATIDGMTVQCARAFVRAPQTRLLRRLFVGGFAFQERGEYDPEDDTFSPLDVHQPARAVLPRWPHFENLRVFQLGWTSDEEYGDFCDFQCHEGGGEVLALVRRMPRLEELYLFADGIDVGGLFALPTLDNLRLLQVYHNWSYPLETLAANPAFSRLTHLLLHPKAWGEWGEEEAPYIKAAGVRALLASPHLPNLTHLRLRLTDIGDAGCEEIVRSGALARLKGLDLRHGCVTDDGARTLAACPDLKHLEWLDLSRNELTEAGVAVLGQTGVRLRVDYQHGFTIGEDDEDRAYLMEGDYE